MTAAFDRAVEFATKYHAGQVRKYSGEPYVTHPIAVAEIIRTVPDHTEAMLIAAVLHDTVEDTEATIDLISETFGVVVAHLVHYVTDIALPEDGNRAIRKQIDAEHYASGPAESQTIKVADLIHNTMSIAAYDPNFWKVYKYEKRASLDLLTKADPALWKRADDLLKLNWDL